MDLQRTLRLHRDRQDHVTEEPQRDVAIEDALCRRAREPTRSRRRGPRRLAGDGGDTIAGSAKLRGEALESLSPHAGRIIRMKRRHLEAVGLHERAHFPTREGELIELAAGRTDRIALANEPAREHSARAVP